MQMSPMNFAQWQQQSRSARHTVSLQNITEAIE